MLPSRDRASSSAAPVPRLDADFPAVVPDPNGDCHANLGCRKLLIESLIELELLPDIPGVDLLSRRFEIFST